MGGGVVAAMCAVLVALIAAAGESGLDVGVVVLVRDSKDPDGAQLTFTRREWLAFLDGVSEGEFGRQG